MFKENYLIKFNSNRQIKNNNCQEVDYFIVNYNWIINFKSLFLNNNILPILSNNQEKIINNKSSNIIEEILNQISNNDKISLISLNEKNILEKLKDNNLYKIFEKQYLSNGKINNYFSQCGILSLEIINELKLNNINIFNKHSNNSIVKCLFGDNKVFIDISNMNQKTIKVGNYNDNYLFNTETIINIINPNNIDIIKENIKQKGYNYVLQLINNYKNEKIHGKNFIIINIVELINKKENKNQIIPSDNFLLNHNDKILGINIQNNNFSRNKLENKNISKQLETLILLCFYHDKIIKKSENSLLTNYKNDKQKLEEIYLININWLNLFGFEKLKNLFNEKIKILLEKEKQKYFQNFIVPQSANQNNFIIENYLDDKQLLTNILNKIDINIFKDFEKNIDYYKENNEQSLFNPQSETIILSRKNSIKILNNFVLVDKNLIQLFCENFKIEKNIPLKLNSIFGNKNVLIVFENIKQNIILLGSILNNIYNLFDCRYFFNFNKEAYLNTELDLIISDISYINKLKKKSQINILYQYLKMII